MMKKTLLYLFVISGALPTLSGCAVGRSIGDAGNAVSDAWVNTWNFLIRYPDQHHAMRSFKKGHYQEAAAQMESLIDRYPFQSGTRGKLLFRQGQAYHWLRDYHNSQDSLRIYLADFPNGKYVQEAEQELVSVSAAAVTASSAKAASEEKLEEAKANLEKLLALSEEYPNDPKIKYYIGNQFYALEQYKKAGEYYFQAQALEASVAEKDLIEKRLFINELGEPEALTPSALRQMEVERNPLVVYDEVTYYQRPHDEAFIGRQIYFNITGKIRNQSQTQTLHNVTLEVRFMNPTQQVLDVQNISIGTLYPNDVRAFLAQTSRYDDLYNIFDYEIIPRGESR